MNTTYRQGLLQLGKVLFVDGTLELEFTFVFFLQTLDESGNLGRQ